MALLLNLLIPGTGLIFRGREWLGFSLALIFGIGGNLTLAGWLIAPLAMPAWFWMLAAVLTAASWMLAQILFRRMGVRSLPAVVIPLAQPAGLHLPTAMKAQRAAHK